MCFGSNMTSKILYQIGVEVLLKKKLDKQCKSHGKDIRRKFKCVKDMYLKLNPLDVDAHTQTNKYSSTYRGIHTDLSEGGFLRKEQY